MRENISLRGGYVIEIIDGSGKLIDVVEISNKLMSINRELRTEMLLGAYTGGADALEIKYFAFGIGTAPVTVNDTRLDREVYRKQITQISSPSSGVVRSVVSLGSVECNTTIKEIGVFCGSSATDEADSGTLMSRVAVNIEKNSNITLNIIRTDTCTI